MRSNIHTETRADLVESGRSECPRAEGTAGGVAHTYQRGEGMIDATCVQSGVPMPPETAQAIRLLKVSLALNVDKATLRAEIEALADQLEARTSGDAG